MGRGFVERHGWTAFAALTSLLWALPLAAWAGAVDFQPSAWYAFGLGLCLLPVWAFLAYRARRWRRPGDFRFEPGQMSSGERAWTLLAALAATGVLGWLNGAATVDWSLLGPGLRAGRPAAWLFLAAALVLLAALGAAAAYCWHRAAASYRRRSAASRSRA